MDEPGNDVQWYFSENHALLFHTAAYLAGHLLPDAALRPLRPATRRRAVGDGARRASARWLDHFERWEMAEFNSAPYFPIDLKGLTALLRARARRRHPRPRRRAAIVRLLEIVANSAHHGVLTAAQGRSYEHSLLRRPRRSSSPPSPACSGARAATAAASTPCRQLALCLRDHGLAASRPRRPSRVWPGDGAQEWCFARARTASPPLYHYKTARLRAWAPPPRYRWGEWGYQETVAARPHRPRTRARRSGSTTPARPSRAATAGRPTGAAARRCRASTSTAASRIVAFDGTDRATRLHPRLVPALRLRRWPRRAARRLRPLRRGHRCC